MAVKLGPKQFLTLGLVASIGWAANQVHSGSSAVALPGVSQTAVGAYVTGAEWANRQHPGCGLDWHLLSGIGAVETGHGTFAGSSLDGQGVASPPIRGPQLNGERFALVLDTDGGALDGDPDYDRAVGPMQFIPASWRTYRPGPTADPQNIRDAAKAAGALLCSVADAESRPLSDPAVEEAAIRSYNDDPLYVKAVRGFASDYRRAAAGGGRGTGEVTPEAVSSKLAEEGRARTAALKRVIDDAPGDYLDRAFGLADPVLSLLWSTMDRDGAGNAAALTASSQADAIVKAAEAWVGREFNPGEPAQCAYFVRQVLTDAGVTLTPEVTGQTLDQWSSPGPGVANSFGGDQGTVISAVEDLRPGDVVMFANTYDDGSNWPAGTITHVAVVVEVAGPATDQITIVDRPTMSEPVKRRPLSTFAHFKGGVRL